MASVPRSPFDEGLEFMNSINPADRPNFWLDPNGDVYYKEGDIAYKCNEKKKAKLVFSPHRTYSPSTPSDAIAKWSGTFGGLNDYIFTGNFTNPNSNYFYVSSTKETPTMKLYLLAAILHDVKNEKHEIIVEPYYALAPNDTVAQRILARAVPDIYADQLDKIELVTRTLSAS